MNLNRRIIQWNCRGLRSNYNEILLLLSLLSPSVFCLQETFLKTDDQFNIRDFNTYNYIYSEGQRPSGGSSILVHSSCPQREIKLVTNLQAVAVSVTLDKEITICSVYIPPNFQLDRTFRHFTQTTSFTLYTSWLLQWSQYPLGM